MKVILSVLMLFAVVDAQAGNWRCDSFGTGLGIFGYETSFCDYVQGANGEDSSSTLNTKASVHPQNGGCTGEVTCIDGSKRTCAGTYQCSGTKTGTSRTVKCNNVVSASCADVGDASF